MQESGVVHSRTGRVWAAVLGFALLASGSCRAEPILLNLKEVPIDALIQTVAEVTGRNFIVDPRVNAKVTAVSAAPVSAEELYAVFLSILDLHGYVAVPAQGMTKIVPAEDAEFVQTLEASALDGMPDGALVSQVFTLRYVSAQQALAAIRPLLGRAAKVTELPDPQKLIVADHAGRLRQAARALVAIDTPRREQVERIGLTSASAGDVARALAALRPEGAGASEARVVVDERTNSILLTGPPEARDRARALIVELDAPAPDGGDTQVIYLRYASAEDLVPILTNVARGVSAVDAGQAQPGAGPTLEADPATNALIVRGQADEIESLQRLVRRLDIRRVEVLIEAIIAEVAIDTTRELGVQWLFLAGKDGRGGAGATSFGPPGSRISGLANSVGGDVPVLNPGLNLAIGRLKDGRVDLGVLLRALAADGHTNVLSTPSLVTLDNAPAEIVVGQNVPFVTGQYTATGAAGDALTPFQTIEREDVGLTLTVRPQVNMGDTVRLEIEQESSSISPSSLGAADIVTNKRALKTTVLAEDGQLVVLGGLIDDSVTETLERVPLLGYLPVMGPLFRYATTSRSKRNLLVFLRPTILYDAQDVAVVTGSKYGGLRREQLRSLEAPDRAVGPNAGPLLPPLDDRPDAPSGNNTPSQPNESPRQAPDDASARPRPDPIAGLDVPNPLSKPPAHAWGH
jgi:general secretion pathway protein D